MPRLSESIRKEIYIEGLVKRLQKLYIYGEAHPEEKSDLKSKLDGYFEAGILIRLISREEIQSVIDEQHLKIFGKTRLQRSKELEAAKESGSLAESDWSGYDLPPSKRGR